MNISDIKPEEVQSRELVGWLDGCPAYQVNTTGGFNMILLLKNGRLEPLGVGPHDRIVIALTKKRHPDMKWIGLQKSETDQTDSAVLRRYEQLTVHIRGMRGFLD